MDTLSLNEQKNKGTIDSEVKQRDLPYLAGFFDNVEYYPDVFELSAAEQTDVRNMAIQSTHIAMTKCLSVWRAHNPGSATFRALIDILEKLGKPFIANKILKYISTS